MTIQNLKAARSARRTVDGELGRLGPRSGCGPHGGGKRNQARRSRRDARLKLRRGDGA